MKWPEREGIVVTGVLSVLLLAWLGFFLHRSPRFPGSGLGAVFGIAGAVLMLVPLAYPIAKRISWFNARITPHVSMKTLLTLHVYAGLLGPLLAIIHTGHKFDSWLGTALTATMLLVVVSGFAVRYLLTFVAHEMKDKLALLQTARGDLDNAWWRLDNSPAEMRVLPRTPVLTAAMASLARRPTRWPCWRGSPHRRISGGPGVLGPHARILQTLVWPISDASHRSLRHPLCAARAAHRRRRAVWTQVDFVA